MQTGQASPPDLVWDDKVFCPVKKQTKAKLPQKSPLVPQMVLWPRSRLPFPSVGVAAASQVLAWPQQGDKGCALAGRGPGIHIYI